MSAVWQLDFKDAAECARGLQGDQDGVTEKAGAEHFGGVTVQTMVRIKDGYEVILGSACDAQFGPVFLFGIGGRLVEV